MNLSRRIALRWLPLAGLATALCAVIYLSVQQVWRHSANDPQIQIADDLAVMLGNGQALESALPHTMVDVGLSLAPFVIVLDDAGKPTAGTGRLHGELRSVPAGVLDHARQSGEERVTWQPEHGVRIATVVRHVAGPAGGFVVAGRSLRESERRTAQFQQLVGLAWALTLVGLLVLVSVSEYFDNFQRTTNDSELRNRNFRSC